MKRTASLLAGALLLAGVSGVVAGSKAKCDADPALGYTLMKRFARIMTERLRAARIQLLDVYSKADQ